MEVNSLLSLYVENAHVFVVGFLGRVVWFGLGGRGEVGLLFTTKLTLLRRNVIHHCSLAFSQAKVVSEGSF